MGDPSLAVRRYFLSQMSNDASWKEMPSTSLGCILTTVFMGIGELPSNYRAKTMSRGAGPDWIKEADWSQLTGTSRTFGHTTYCVRTCRVRLILSIVKTFFQRFFPKKI